MPYTLYMLKRAAEARVEIKKNNIVKLYATSHVELSNFFGISIVDSFGESQVDWQSQNTLFSSWYYEIRCIFLFLTFLFLVVVSFQQPLPRLSAL